MAQKRKPQNKVNIIWENGSIMTNPLHILYLQFKFKIEKKGTSTKMHNNTINVHTHTRTHTLKNTEKS